MSLAIRVEKVSKAYRIGEIGTETIVWDLQRRYAKIRGRQDPLLTSGEANDRTTRGGSDIVWSLRDVSFEVEQGDAMGIVGRNGAGKSTLLKILSRVTAPTLGKIQVKGRVASLLEVGTGFHPELTGRENVFLNGAILGMRKREIEKKFDAIVDFASIERYIDTPVRRYSSGMYVRLAFAVAAYLESEILIIDEVLAVGDLEFQRKCMGKMNDVSRGEGRTVLFVSHNLSSVAALTNTSVLMNNGLLVAQKTTMEIIQQYLEQQQAETGVFSKAPTSAHPSFTRVEVVTSEPSLIQSSGHSLEVHVEINVPAYIEGLCVSFQIINDHEVESIYASLPATDQSRLSKSGRHRLKCIFPYCRLYEGKYYLKLSLGEHNAPAGFDVVDKVCQFEVQILDRVVEWGWQKNLCIYMEDFEWYQEST